MLCFRRIALVMVALALAGCSDTSTPSFDRGDGTPSFAISTSEGFYFLPPMVPNPGPFSGTFNPNQSPEVRVCVLPACTTVIKTFNGGTKNEALTVDLAGESYGALWNTRNNPRGLQNGKDKYRLEVYVGDELLGYADLWFVSNAKQLKDVTSGYVGVVNGSNLNIKFRIETGVIEGAPDAVDDDYATAANMPLEIFAPGVLANDDLGDPLATLTHFGGGSLGGNVTANAAGSTAAFGSGGTLTVNTDGSFSFTPSTGFEGDFTFQYRIANSAGSDVALVTITVAGAATAPVAKDDEFTVQVGEPLTGDLREDKGNGADELGVPTATVVSYGGGSLGGSVTSNPTTPGNSVGLAGGTLTVDAAGTFSLTGTTQTGPVTFLYRLENVAGHSDATVTIEITAGPPPPVAPTAVDDSPAANSAPGDAFHTAFNTTLNSATHATPSVLANDDLGSPAAVLTHFGGGTLGGTVTSNLAASTASNDGHSLTVNADGSFAYTPKAGFTGPFTFEYRIANAAGSDDALVTIAVGARPVANNDTYPHTLVGNVSINTASGTPYSVLGNDTGDALTVALSGSPSNGELTLNADGTFTFNPAAGFRSGNGSFQYTVSNGFGTSPAATVSIPVGAQVIWFINNAAAECTTLAAGCGRLSHAFSTLAAFQALNNGTGSNPADNHHIFLYESATAYTGGVTLRAGQRLIGQDATSTLLSLTGVTLPPHSPALPAMNTGAPATRIVNGSGNGVALGSGSRLHGLTLGNASGVALTGSNFGTLTLSDVRINTTGQALSLTTGTISGEFAEVRSTGGTNNVFLSGVATSSPVALGTAADALSGASSHALVISGQNGTFSYSGGISNAGGKQVSIASKTGGTVSLSGAIGGTGTGIELSSNTGATINFTGALTLSTGTNAAFSATGGGTVTATNTTSTLVTTTATALRVENTVIGASGLTFQSISAGTAANGPTNGIVLNSTGNTAGLTVTGSGSAGSGGTIQRASGDGIRMVGGVRNVSLSHMVVTTNNGNGIYGDEVTDFTLTSSQVTNNDADHPTGTNESGLFFHRLYGTNTVRGSTISGTKGDEIRWEANGGVQGSLRVVSTTLGPNPAGEGGNGFAVVAINDANLTAVLDSSTVTGVRTSGFLTAFANTVTTNVMVRNNTFSGNNMGIDHGIGGGNGSFTFTGNTLVNHRSNAFNIISDALSTTSTRANGTISNNTVGDGSGLSGSQTASGIAVDIRGGAQVAVSVTNNLVRNTELRPIVIETRQPNGPIAGARGDFIVTGNQAGPPLDAFGGAIEGIYVTSRDSRTTCLHMTSNTATGLNQTGYRVRQANAAVFHLQGLNVSGTNATAVAGFIAGQNTGTASVQTAGTGTVVNYTAQNCLTSAF